MGHPNSADSERQANKEKRYEQILYYLIGSSAPLTDREIMRGLGYTDPNAVRPRITELVKAAKLIERDNKRDMETGRTVRTVEVPRGQQALL